MLFAPRGMQYNASMVSKSGSHVVPCFPRSKPHLYDSEILYIPEAFAVSIFYFTTVLLCEIRSCESTMHPAPAHIPVFAGLGLHSTRHGADSLHQISLGSTVQTDRYNTELWHVRPRGYCNFTNFQCSFFCKVVIGYPSHVLLGITYK